MKSFDEKRIAGLQEKYDLSYHIPYAIQAHEMVDLQDKHVLEVGGSLPAGFVSDDLCVKQWVAIEEPSYWHELQDGGGTPPSEAPTRLLVKVDKYTDLQEYSVLAGGIEDLPQSMENCFDVVFSIAAFEHILMMPLALDRMYAALKPGGSLFTMFSPIWSAHDGHHLPDMTDKSGKAFGFHRSPIPPWGHLLMRPPQLLKYLLDYTDLDTATRIVYYTYHSQHINRLFTEDYLAYIKNSPFEIANLAGTFKVDIPENIQSELVSLYQGRESFSNNGILAVLKKPAG